jgi:hypothetical protein
MTKHGKVHYVNESQLWFNDKESSLGYTASNDRTRQ